MHYLPYTHGGTIYSSRTRSAHKARKWRGTVSWHVSHIGMLALILAAIVLFADYAKPLLISLLAVAAPIAIIAGSVHA